MAYMGYGVKPDISTLAKGLGGGIPIGATLTTGKIAKAFQPGTHGSTFGGNPLACEVAKKVVEIVSSQKVLKGVMKKTFIFHEKLNKLSVPAGEVKAAVPSPIEAPSPCWGTY